MFDTFDFMAFNWCCILGGPYYPTLPYTYYTLLTMPNQANLPLVHHWLLFYPRVVLVSIYMYDGSPVPPISTEITLT